MQVLLLEAGGKDDYHWIHVPVGYLYCIGNPRTDWLYKTQPEPGLNGRALRYPRGKVLGGSSSINGMIYMRGQRATTTSWAQRTGDPAWSWASAARASGRTKITGAARRRQRHAGAATTHSRRGRRVAGRKAAAEVEDSRRVFARPHEDGIPATDDFNRGDNTGVGYFDVNQKRGIRWNASKAFLRPA